MGLDMYLQAHPTGTRDVDEVGSWRKANQVHGWFNRRYGGLENCVSVDVLRYDLLALRATCEIVLDNPSKGPDLLPCTQGFFFGGEDYGAWYERDLRETISIVDKALALPPKWRLSYYAWW